MLPFGTTQTGGSEKLFSSWGSSARTAGIRPGAPLRQRSAEPEAGR